VKVRRYVIKENDQQTESNNLQKRLTLLDGVEGCQFRRSGKAIGKGGGQKTDEQYGKGGVWADCEERINLGGRIFIDKLVV